MSNDDIPQVDYTTMGPKSKGDVKKNLMKLPNGVRWWLAEDKMLPSAVMSQVSRIIQADRGRIDSYNTFAKMYGTYTPTYWNGYQLSNSGRPTAPMRDRLTYNIAQSAVDTLTNRIAQNKPKPMFLTSAGDSKLQRKAKKLDSYCYGLFYQNGVYQMGPKGGRDSYVFGEGIIHPYNDNGTVRFERVLPYEILVDYLESHYGPESTKSMFRIKNIDRTQLAEAYPAHAEQISIMTNTSAFISAAGKSVGDTVTVVEAWRLPVGNQPGRHVIVAGDFTILDEDYEDDFFPFAIKRYCSRLYGFYAQGMVEQLLPTQIEINRTLISIQRSLYLGGTHKIFVKAGSKVIKSHFDNMIGTILEYAGDTAPQYIVPQLVQPEIYKHLNEMKSSGYNLVGVSQMSASNVKQPGVDSGRAMRTADNIEMQRFSTESQAYEDFFSDIAKISVSVAKKAYLENSKLSINVPGKRFIEKINWKDVDLENDEFSLQIYPTSKLPMDPEGRIQTIQELMQAGLMDPRVGKRLLDFPDLDEEENLSNSTLDYLHKILDEMVEEGKFTAPDSYDDLETAKKLALEYYAKGKLNNLDEDKLDLLRQFMAKIDQLTQPPPMAPPAGPPQGPAPANPTPTPTSDLIPNVNPGAPQPNT